MTWRNGRGWNRCCLTGRHAGVAGGPTMPCAQLLQTGMWGLLAYSWLSYRPEAWVPDVAAFLEYTEGFGAGRPLVTP
ncbi:MAG: hypothetical protein ACRDRR_14895 [Pseudonocardiaceae bacterium]